MLSHWVCVERQRQTKRVIYIASGWRVGGAKRKYGQIYTTNMYMIVHRTEPESNNKSTV